ncbi:CYTH domain-containing protein [Sinorhizobium saheli]|uniref:Adenylate cyclase n=1 Tax=Sinorhizobium saheli TaxID=36856 RepID=A0A178XLS7_SINSA|nr:CYTH domain-containing protein [Sinorhizobium saheli]MQW87558.1 CYTH domain-containing protein [Sinorhizobium saheli]OAP35753.1 adenylate cyclase [Sinorhizobium saheli]
MAKEIERKFLVATDGWRQNADKGIRLRQAYIVTMDDRSLRVRIHGNKRARLTIKIGKSSLVRNEYEYDLPIDDARELLTQAVGIVIEKRRYRVPYKGFTWEVDVYEGALEGLVVAEVEMKRETDLPDLPAWLGREITGDRRYSNQSLATEGLLETQP